MTGVGTLLIYLWTIKENMFVERNKMSNFDILNATKTYVVETFKRRALAVNFSLHKLDHFIPRPTTQKFYTWEYFMKLI